MYISKKNINYYFIILLFVSLHSASGVYLLTDIRKASAKEAVITKESYLKESHSVNKEIHSVNSIDSKPFNCIIQLEHGNINWTTGIIRASGVSKSVKKGQKETSKLPLESAVNDARKNLFNILSYISISALESSFKADYSKHDSNILDNTILEQIKKKVVNAKVIGSRNITDNNIETEIQISMYGDFLKALLPNAIKDIQDIEIFIPANKEPVASEKFIEEQQLQSRKHRENIKSNTNNFNNSGDFNNLNRNRVLKYTGIIIDARDIGFKPAVSPIVISEQGEEIYSPVFISRKYAVERGVCSYIYDIDSEFILKKAGAKPLTIKALRKDEKNNNKIVISMYNADTIQKMAERHQFMKRCNVIILVSPIKS